MNREIEKHKTALAKRYGEDSIYIAGDAPPVEVVSTGSVSLDFATGIGGLPRGTIVEIFGIESVGKTSLMYYMMREHQKKGRPSMLINLEGSFDPYWAQAISGLDISNKSDAPLLVVNVDNGVEAVEVAADSIASGNYGVVALDSIGAMLGEKESTPGAPKQAFGQSGLVTHMVKLCTRPADRTKTVGLFLNQVRDAPPTGGHTNPFAVKAPGGRAVKHQAAIRIQLKRGADRYQEIIHGNKIEVGFRVVANVLKNKASAPHGIASWNFWNRPHNGIVGIDTTQEILDLAFNYNVIPHTGGGYYEHELFPEGRIRGKDPVVEFLMQDEEVREKIRQELIALSYSEIAPEDKVEV